MTGTKTESDIVQFDYAMTMQSEMTHLMAELLACRTEFAIILVGLNGLRGLVASAIDHSEKITGERCHWESEIQFVMERIRWSAERGMGPNRGI